MPNSARAGLGTQSWWSNTFLVDEGPLSRRARPEMLVPASWGHTGQLGEPVSHPEGVRVRQAVQIRPLVVILHSALGLEAVDPVH